MAKKYYAVRTGRNPGIYRTWDQCKKQVMGYPAAQYKGFATEEDGTGLYERRRDKNRRRPGRQQGH